MADSNYSYARWLELGSPGGDFSAWQKAQPGYGAAPGATSWEEWSANNGSSPSSRKEWGALNPAGATQVEGPGNGYAPGSPSNDPNHSTQMGVDNGEVSPATFEERMAAGEFAGNEGQATQLEVERRRRLIATNANGSGGPNGGFDALPPDIADVVLKDSSGRVRKARGGSTRSALGQAFRPTAPIGSSSILGDY